MDIADSPAGLERLAEMRGFLVRTGWLRTAVERRPMDAKGRPVPWYTHACTHFLGARVNNTMHVFEYGSGYSTLWWSRRAASVTSCEHKRAFINEIQQSAPDNVTYIHKPADPPGDYANTPLEQDRKFDIVVIDGEDRLGCAKVAPKVLTDGGVILFDNASKKFQDAFDHLKRQGFRELDFYGHGPIFSQCWVTTIFYRPGNVLGI